MEAAGVSTTRLARELDISYQAVKKVLLGGSAGFNTENNAAAARYLGVNSGGFFAAGFVGSLSIYPNPLNYG